MSGYLNTKVTLYEFDDRLKHPLPLIFNLNSICFNLCGIRTKTGSYVWKEKTSLYHKFNIPKKDKSGNVIKLRKIQAPQAKLKYIHTVLNGVFSKIPLPDNVAAYIPGKTYIPAVEKHVNKDILIHMDIKNFFNSTRRAWIRKFFTDEIGYPYYAASWLATLCTCSTDLVDRYDKPIRNKDGSQKVIHFLPQGSPLSGYLANLVFWHRAGKHIKLKLAKLDSNWNFTIYSDDITMSYPHDMDREKVDAIITQVTNIIEDAGYQVNKKKTRVQRRGSPQQVLGCSVTEKLNIPRKKYNKIRCLIHNCKLNGFQSQAERCGKPNGGAVIQYIRGMLQYFKQIREDRFDKLNDEFEEALTINHMI